MKKLMVAIAAVASAFGLYADGLNNQIDFKDSYLNVNDALDVTKTDAGQTAEGATRGWYSATPDETGVAAQDDVLDQKVLAVDNSSPLYRTVVGNNGTMVPQAIDDSGIFFDTKVKFTVGDIETQNLDTGAKLAIWVGADEEAATPYTNLYVTAGSIAGQSITATNFTANLPANFDFGAWHRVTVRTIKQAVANQSVPGFVIFVDETAIECADTDYATKIGSFTASDAAAEFLNSKKLFLSLVDGGAVEAQKVSGLGFSGSGSLANVGITDYANAPEFARGAKVFALSWTDGVTGFTANDEVISGLTAAGTTNITLTTSDLVTVTGVNYAEGYMKGTWVNYDETKNAFVWTVDKPAGSIVADKVAFMIGNDKYATFADALAAALATGEPTTITLAADLAAWDGEVTIDSGDITLDLAGKTIEVADYDDYDLFFVTGGKLTVIDSLGDGAITVTDKAESAYTGIFAADGGTINIGLDDGDDENVTINGILGTVTTIFKGKFDKANNEKDDLENYLDDENTYEVVEDGDDYWKVQKKGEEPTTWTVEVPAAADHTALSVMAGKDELGTTGGVYTVAAEISEVSVRYSIKDDGYDWADPKAEKSWNVEKGQAVTINAPAVTAIVYTITFATDRGTAPADTTYTVESTFPITLPTIDGVTGANFKGWTNETYTTAITELAKPEVLGNIALVAEWELLTGEPAKVLNDLDGDIPEGKVEQATANATALVKAMGDAAHVATWVEKVYGTGNKIPAATLANAPAASVEIAVAFDVPVMVEPTISAPVVAEKTTGPAAFEFAIKDGATEVEIKTLTENVKKLIKYASALDGENAFAPAKETEVGVGLSEGKIKAEFLPGPTAGFMKADFNVAK